IDARLPTFFPYNRPHPLSDLTAQDLVAIFGDPHDMEVDGNRCMGAMAIVSHVPQSTQNLLKLPPKGGGFDPPNWRQEARKYVRLGGLRDAPTGALGRLERPLPGPQHQPPGRGHDSTLVRPDLR